MEQKNYITPIMLAPVEELLSGEFLVALAERFVEKEFSRLGAIDWLDERLFCWPGDIVEADGTPFVLYTGEREPFKVQGPSIIEVAYDFEETYSWNSNVQKFATCPPRRRPNTSLLLRLKLWDAAFKIDADPIVLPG